MDFLALTRAQYIGFELKPIESEKAEKKGLMILSLQPSNFLIRLVMDPIILSYDLETMRLLRFEGLTNIERVNKGKGLGENYIARIEYSYP